MTLQTKHSYSQKGRHIAVETPLGDDVLLLTSFAGHEEMSRLFTYRLEMFHVEDPDAGAPFASGNPHGRIDPEQIIGKRINVRVLLPKQDPEEDDRFRYFNGIVSRFAAGGREGDFRVYQAEMVPWLWMLTQVSDCRIFNDQEVPKVLEWVFKHFGFRDSVDYNLKGIKAEHKHKWPPSGQDEDKGEIGYRVQYRETCFNFISRLMEQAGIYYYFRHEKDKHTLVAGDDAKAYASYSPKTVPCGPRDEEQWIQAWDHEYQFTPGQWAQADYHFKQPARNEQVPRDVLLTERPGERLWEQDEKYEVYDYPGAYDSQAQGEWYTRVRMEETDVRNDVVRGVSNCRYFSPGHVFKPAKHAFKSEEEEDFLITAVDHHASVLSSYLGAARRDPEYTNTFACIPAATPFRPERRTLKPRIHGSQTAVVVGPPDKEIHVDKYGRVKVQFFWDPISERDAKRCCWVRCAQLIAGKNWGAMFIPRVGQEVVVTFLEGDPDRPLVTGVVYNADQMPPYNPEEHPTRSYVKTNSSPGGDGYNEVRFEDKKDKEQVFIHAQRNMDVRVRASSMETVGGSRHTIIGGEKDGKKWGDLREKIYKDKHVHVGGEQREKIDGRMELHVLGDEFKYVEGDSSSKVCQFRSEEYDQLWTVVNKAHVEEAKTEYTLKTAEAVFETGKTAVNASQEIVLKGPGGFIKIDASGVTIEGNLVKVNCGSPPPVVGATIKSEPIDASDLKGPEDPTAADRHKTGQKSAPDVPEGSEPDSPYGE